MDAATGFKYPDMPVTSFFVILLFCLFSPLPKGLAACVQGQRWYNVVV